MNGEQLCSMIGQLTLICIVLSIFLLGSLVVIILFYRSNRKHQSQLLELSRYSINVQAIIDKNVPLLLNDIIDDCFRDYEIMVLAPKNELYITDEREKEIRNDLVEIVVKRLSPMALDKISLFYNVHNIDEIIAEKVYITVMNYVVSHNAVIEQRPQDKK